MYVCFYVETTTIKHLPANSIPQIVLPVFTVSRFSSLSLSLLSLSLSLLQHLLASACNRSCSFGCGSNKAAGVDTE